MHAPSQHVNNLNGVHFGFRELRFDYGPHSFMLLLWKLLPSWCHRYAENLLWKTIIPHFTCSHFLPRYRKAFVYIFPQQDISAFLKKYNRSSLVFMNSFLPLLDNLCQFSIKSIIWVNIKQCQNFLKQALFSSKNRSRKQANKQAIKQKPEQINNELWKKMYIFKKCIFSSLGISPCSKFLCDISQAKLPYFV